MHVEAACVIRDRASKKPLHAVTNLAIGHDGVHFICNRTHRRVQYEDHVCNVTFACTFLI